VFIVSVSLLREILDACQNCMHGIVAYKTCFIYMKKITSFCQVLKEMHTKENCFFFLRHGVVWAAPITFITAKLCDEQGTASLWRHFRFRPRMSRDDIRLTAMTITWPAVPSRSATAVHAGSAVVVRQDGRRRNRRFRRKRKWRGRRMRVDRRCVFGSVRKFAFQKYPKSKYH